MGLVSDFEDLNFFQIKIEGTSENSKSYTEMNQFYYILY